MRFRLLMLLGALLTLSSCTSRDGDLNFFSIEDDEGLGARFNEEMLNDPSSYPMLDEKEYPEVYSRLNRIVQKILKSDDIYHREEFAWKVHVLQDDTMLNAFCTPGGYIYVYTGLLRYLDSEDQLAGVLGHEMAHADLRHSTEQMTKNTGLKIVLHLLFGDGSVLGDMAGGIAGLSFSRSDETEADLQSVRYLYDTDYDPRGVARFFEKMEQKGETLGPMVFLSTHPNPENRVKRIMEEWKKLGSRKGRTFKDEYQVLKDELP
ncbi:MAG: M48 family metallopeptidase [Bacteroidia bacterium]